MERLPGRPDGLLREIHESFSKGTIQQVNVVGCPSGKPGGRLALRGGGGGRQGLPMYDVRFEKFPRLRASVAKHVRRWNYCAAGGVMGKRQRGSGAVLSVQQRISHPIYVFAIRICG